jgi:hypothetical protein
MPQRSRRILKIFDHLVHCANQYAGALEDLVGSQLHPTARSLLCRLAVVVRHDNPLHQRIHFELRVSVRGYVSYQLHALVDFRYSPS